YSRKASSEIGLPGSYRTGSFPRVFLTTDVGWLRGVCSLMLMINGDGCFRVKDVRRLLDDMLLPKSDVPSRWVKQIPIKVNVLAWKISMDRLPTRVNLHRRGVQVSPISCPICCEALENLDHLLFCCDLAKDIARFNQVQNKCWKECFTLPGGVSGHIETISSSLIQIFEKMVFLKT
ncbi:RNA-directed DNA polymerase, eukaryota, partial [Tanacetum coccineum]